MSALYIDRRGATIDLEGETIVVRIDGQREGTAPLRTLDRVVVQGSAHVATRLVTRLAERGIGLTLLPSGGRQPASVLSPARGDAALRLAQLRLLSDEHRRAGHSRDLVRAKIAGQTSVIRRKLQTRSDPRLLRAVNAMDRASEGLSSDLPVPDRATLRGIEGAAAAAYFEGLRAIFAPALGYHGRNRRPPRDPVNVCLSLGYTLLHHRAAQAAAAQGLDPAIGIYHDVLPGRDSLACDLAEPLRSMVDAAVVSFFAERTLTVDHFSTQGQACRIGKAGRSAVYRGFEERLSPATNALRRAVLELVSELRHTDLPAPAHVRV